ncbi:MAG TPA: GIY-YIG nuclease family protein [Bacteroidota bacterium]|nr:GIY-YIG nuclease family protein [Bacteroidota bacterium]
MTMKRALEGKQYGGNAIRKYFFYSLASQNRGTLCAGVTNNLRKRIIQHKDKNIPGFTNQYRISRLVHFEEDGDACDPIARKSKLRAG